jgi:hypothetical protein
MFLKVFYEVACALLCFTQSRNNKKWPNKKNDVITDLGGEGDFPMFRCGTPFFSAPQLLPIFARLSTAFLLTQRVAQF